MLKNYAHTHVSSLFAFGLMSLSLLMASCSPASRQAADPSSEAIRGEDLPVLKEAFQTDRDLDLNVDSPAVWHGPDGDILFATAKEGDEILQFDAATGDVLRSLGRSGTGEMEFDRPNGIWVIDDLLLVVERDNARVQVIHLPELTFAGFITHEDLRYPYGLSVHAAEAESGWMYELYVTDNYNPALEGYPAEEQLDERVHHFRFSVEDEGDGVKDGLVLFESVSLFGDIAGEGMLLKVESILADPAAGRLFIADEAYASRDVKIYSLEGEFTGETISNRYFSSEPEGLALYDCGDGSGYLLMTDQHKSEENKYVVLDRQTLSYLGAFRGEITRNTDGIWLTQHAFGPFEMGAFYAVHDDGSVTAFDWAEIARVLGLDKDCTLRGE